MLPKRYGEGGCACSSGQRQTRREAGAQSQGSRPRSETAQPPEEPRMFRRAVAFIASLLMLVAVPAAACGADSTISPGTVRFAKGAESSFDVYTQSPTAAQK